MPTAKRAAAYDTRVDSCRRKFDVSVGEWAKAAKTPPSMLRRYLNGEDEPLVEKLARLVRSFRQISGKPIRASDLYDLGEDAPPKHICPQPSPGTTITVIYDTRFGRFVALKNVRASVIAKIAKRSVRSIGRNIAGKESMTPSTLADIVRALRTMGHDVCASFIVDVGDDELERLAI